MSYIQEYLFEVNEFPKYGEHNTLHTIKDYFYYDSDVKEYGYRSLIVPLSSLINKEAVPDIGTIKELIDKKIPVLEYTGGNWSFKND
jgi:hypothetical protein